MTYAVYHKSARLMWGSLDEPIADVLARFASANDPDTIITLAPPADPGDDPTDTPCIGLLGTEPVILYQPDDADVYLLTPDPVQIIGAETQLGAILIARGSLPQPEYNATQF
jgi:hypothetical protein